MRALGLALVLTFGMAEGPRAENAAPVAVAGPDRVATVGEVLRFDAAESHDPDGTALGYRWRFGDGAGATGRVVRHAYWAPGVYLVQLQVADDARPPAFGADRLRVTVRAAGNRPPEAEAGPDLRVTLGQPLRLDARESRDPDGAVLAYRWRLGDGQSAQGPVVDHLYARPGVYAVELAVSDDRGATARDGLTVIVEPPPNAAPVAVAGPDRRVAPGARVAFSAEGSHDPDGHLIGWTWRFGDGRTAEGPAAVHAFAAPGVYTVSLTVEDDSGAASGRATDTARVTVNAPPVAEAGADRRSRTLVQNFDAGLSRDPDGRIARVHWAFGDGSEAEGPRVRHSFPRPGRYAVTLTVTDDSGVANGQARDRLTVEILPPPIADAGPARRVGLGARIGFDAGAEIGPELEARWSFGDGTRATGVRVDKRYERPGVYPVRLAIHDRPGGQLLAADETEVRVNAPPIARAGPDLRVAPGAEIRLDAGASRDPDGEIHRYIWQIGETLRRSPVPGLVWRFDTPGAHPVELTVIDGPGPDAGRASDRLTVFVNAPPIPDAGPDRVVADRRVSFDAVASRDPDGDALGYAWAFGDGARAEGARVSHVYAGPGTYRVRLDVDDGTGFANARAQDTATVRVNAPPVAEAGENLQICAGNVVSFDGRGSRDPDGDPLAARWVFDDGTVLEGATARRSFEAPGIHGATLVVDDGSGVANATARDRIFVAVDPRPVAEAGPDRLACQGQAIAFDGTGSRDLDGVVNRYRWSFGDGATGAGPRPSHSFAVPGDYRVALTIEGDPLPRCDNTAVDWAEIRVQAAPQLAIRGPGSAAEGAEIVLEAEAQLPGAEDRVLAYRWDLGDGTTARGAEVRHRYARPGEYLVGLRIATSGSLEACRTATAEHTVRVNARPEAVLRIPAVVPAHTPVRLDASASHDRDGMLIGYDWEISDGTRLAGVDAAHVFAEPGVYALRLAVTDDSGEANAVGEARAEVRVVAAPTLEIDGPAVSCVGAPVTWRPRVGGGFDEGGGVDEGDAGGGGTETRIAWDLGDGAVSDLDTVTHVYRRPGRLSVTAVLAEVIGGTLVTREASRTHRVNARPVASARPVGAVCPGAAVILDGGRSRDPDGDRLAARWELGDGRTAEGLAATVRYPAPGRYRPRLRVDDGLGSACSIAETGLEVRVNAPPVAEAGPDRRVALRDGTAEVVLDARGSSDPDQANLAFHWLIDGETAREGARVVHRFDRPGRYPVTLTVSDLTGLPCGIASDSLTVDVVPEEPR
ncbi:MAG: PKD domain-containing protein [Paracoccaceae bacterium]